MIGLEEVSGQYVGTHAVPVTLNTYAPEILYLRSRAQTTLPGTQGQFDRVRGLQLNIVTLTATAVVEVDILKPGGNPATAGDWYLALQTYSAAGLQAALPLEGVVGVRIRLKSGGTAGTTTLAAWWSDQSPGAAVGATTTITGTVALGAGAAVIGHVINDASEAHLGEVGAAEFDNSDSFTRLNNATPYTIGDVISADANNTGTTPLRSLTVARAAGRGVQLRFLSFRSSITVTFLPTVRVHFYNVAAPTTALAGDNLAFVDAVLNFGAYLGYVDLPAMALHGTDNFVGAQRDDLDLTLASPADTKVYYRVEITAGTGITPAGLEVFTLRGRGLAL